ncbi:MAG: hypothetical protein IKX40_07155 [Thermoguttaceae bacterium]|nr:hypothetical protein [Thermoguttaceae bacterium]
MSDSNNDLSKEINEDPGANPQDDKVKENPFAMTDAKRRRLEQLFDHATIQYNQKNYDYASDLYIQCIASDPGNMTYVQAYLENLRKKYNNNRKGDPMGFFKIGTPRKAAKKALGAKEYQKAFENGLQALRVNPWDVQTLTILWETCIELGFTETPLAYMKIALEGNPKDIGVNKSLANVLKSLHRFNEAISCWRRIEQCFPNGNEEAARNITELIVAKNRYETGGRNNEDKRTAATVETTSSSGEKVQMSQEDFLKNKIKERPKEAARYIALADYYIALEQFDKAEATLTDAVKQTGETENRDLLDKLEDSALRNLRQKLVDIERTKGKNSEEWKKMRMDLNTRELDVWKGRCERYPNNLAFKYELGLRYKINGDYNNAIMQFQPAQNEPRRKGVCCLQLGMCFQAIKQYQMAIASYDQAIENIPDRDAENKKRAYYEAGRLTLGLKQLELAEKYLKLLAGMDFNYKDVASLLDKLEELRNNMDS